MIYPCPQCVPPYSFLFSCLFKNLFALVDPHSHTAVLNRLKRHSTSLLLLCAHCCHNNKGLHETKNSQSILWSFLLYIQLNTSLHSSVHVAVCISRTTDFCNYHINWMNICLLVHLLQYFAAQKHYKIRHDYTEDSEPPWYRVLMADWRLVLSKWGLATRQGHEAWCIYKQCGREGQLSAHTHTHRCMYHAPTFSVIHSLFFPCHAQFSHKNTSSLFKHWWPG